MRVAVASKTRIPKNAQKKKNKEIKATNHQIESSGASLAVSKQGQLLSTFCVGVGRLAGRESARAFTSS